MAKYTVTHRCGHDQIQDLYGPRKDRESKMEWLVTTKYTTCWVDERKHDPITSGVICNIFSNGIWIAVTTGDTFKIKDALKAAGCQIRSAKKHG